MDGKTPAAIAAGVLFRGFEVVPCGIEGCRADGIGPSVSEAPDGCPVPESRRRTAE